MAIARIEALLKEKIGLDAISIGTASIERAVRERRVACACPDAPAYLALLLGSELEMQALIETVVVPESWFFRDRKAFVALARITHEHCSRHPDGMLRALSLPCSTGEEPYSMAMTLLDAGIPPQRFQVDAIDISARVIARAERGIYGKNSFRDKNQTDRERHFEPMDALYRLHDNVRMQVRFRQGNLFEADSIYGALSFDVIFCRNVLIYFDRPTQARAVAILGRLLAPTGVLFVGPSETSVLQDQGFVTAKMPLAFAFRKALAATSHVHKAKPRPALVMPIPATRVKPVASTAAAEPRHHRSAAPAVTPALVTPALATPVPSTHWLDTAQQLADQGNLVDALAHCEQHMNQDTPSAAAFYLLGLLHDAGGRTQQACEQYRKALYLDPGHAQALVHLAMALRTAGDARGAQLLFDRATRAQDTGGK